MIKVNYIFCVLFLCSNALSGEVVQNPVEHWAEYPEINYGVGEEKALLEKGEYLVKAGDCIACHTSSTKQPFAGGNAVKPTIPLLGMQIPIGTFYSPNITPDKKTGIGRWTEAEFSRAMRHGVSPDGSQYYPVFPYVWFTKLSENDIKAMYAYMMRIPAIEKENKPHDIPWIMQWRFLMLGWKLLFFYPFDGEFKPDPEQTDQWNRGAFLVEGPGHCGMCHTPVTMFGSPQRDMAYTGSVIDGYAAPNITGSSLKKVSVDKLVRVFLYDELPGGGQVRGPMKEVNHDSLVYLKQSDLEAISVYLKSTVDPKPLKLSGSGMEKASLIYNKYCVNCHASGAGGAPKYGDVMGWQAIIEQGKEKTYTHAINGYNSMPAMGSCADCTDDDIKLTVDYMLQAVESGGDIIARPLGEPPVEYTLKDGERVFNEVCVTCHQEGTLGALQLGDPRWGEVLDRKGFFGMLNGVIHPRGYENTKGDCVKRGACKTCDDGILIAAVKYIINQSVEGANYVLW
ncbi:MAG: cytochrome C [Legionellales bacterium]|nr:cytochrome C [Legionellales bacterium]